MGFHAAPQYEMRSVDEVFSRVKRELSSFDAIGVLNEHNWIEYVMDILHELGSPAQTENQCVIHTENLQAKLPVNFHRLYAAWSCMYKGNSIKSSKPELQDKIVLYVDNECENIKNKCLIDNCIDEAKRITVRTYIDAGHECCRFYDEPMLLRLGPSVKRICDGKSPNFSFNRGVDQIEIDNGYLYSNFDGAIFLQYYGLPLDEEGTPLYPDNNAIRLALVEYIKFKELYDMHLNGTAPDLERRVGLQNQMYISAMSKAESETKLPSWAGMERLIRKRRFRFSRHELNTNGTTHINRG